MLQNLNLPVPFETHAGGEDYYLSLQRAVTEAGANTLDAKNLRDQLETLNKQNELLGDVADNTDRIRNLTPPWRQ